METVKNSNGIRKEVSKSQLTVSNVGPHKFKPEVDSAELRQIATTTAYYPKKKVSNSLQDNLFGLAEFGEGFTEEPFVNESTYVAWIDVPKGTDAASVQAKITALGANAVLYRTMSNRPILSDSDQAVIDNPKIERSLEDYANSQVVRYPEGHKNAGEIALDTNGKVQYRRVEFSATGKEDQDLRTPEPKDYYVSQELHTELTGEVTAAQQM